MSIDKVRTGTQSFAAVIANVVSWFSAVPDGITHFADQVWKKLILQLIKCTSRVLQKLLKYFNCTIILTFLPSAAGWPVFFVYI